jgi:N-acetylglucosamine-6-phosphate deacetylase
MNSPARQAISAEHVFDGTTLHRDAVVVIEGSRIAAILPKGDANSQVTTLPDGVWLAPGFVDVQVNGGGDVLFNNAPTAATIAIIAAAHRKFGTTGLLVTLISDMPEKIPAAIDAVREAMRTEPSVLGLHLEGPFLSRAKAGVHNPDFIRPPTPADIELLTAARDGALMVTVAPECLPPGLIARLVASGVRVSLGHSNATYEQTRVAIAEGLSGFTHLFNAMRGLQSREPGPIAAALEAAGCSYGLIVDGVHVAPAMLRLALRGAGNPMLVTDAMPPVGGSRTSFILYGQEIRVSGDRCTRSDGTLAGALLDMASAVRNCVRLLGWPLESALRLATANPGDFLGLKVGRLLPGYRADLIALDARNIEVLGTWVEGKADMSTAAFLSLKAPPGSRPSRADRRLGS